MSRLQQKRIILLLPLLILLECLHHDLQRGDGDDDDANIHDYDVLPSSDPDYLYYSFSWCLWIQAWSMMTNHTVVVVVLVV